MKIKQAASPRCLSETAREQVIFLMLAMTFVTRGGEREKEIRATRQKHRIMTSWSSPAHAAWVVMNYKWTECLNSRELTACLTKCHKNYHSSNKVPSTSLSRTCSKELPYRCYLFLVLPYSLRHPSYGSGHCCLGLCIRKEATDRHWHIVGN